MSYICPTQCVSLPQAAVENAGLPTNPQARAELIEKMKEKKKKKENLKKVNIIESTNPQRKRKRN